MDVSLIAVLGCVAGAMMPPGFLKQHDLIWEVPPVRWLDGIPLANGDIGALVWGDGAPIKVTLDKYDAWETREKPLEDVTYETLRQWVKEGRRREAEETMRSERIYGSGPHPTRLPMPRLELDLGGAVDWKHARLRIEDATAEISGKRDGKPIRLLLFVHAHRNVLIARLTGKPAASAKVHVGLDHLNDGAKKRLAAWGYPDPIIESAEKNGSLLLKAPTGFQYAAAWHRVAHRNEQVIALALLSTADASDPLAAARALAAETAESPEFASHKTWWAEYWQRSFLTVPDARLEALYYAEMYKLGCLSRPGKWPITLQGLWTLDGGMPPWAGDYHLDMNVQQSYWPIYTANRLELGEPLYRVFSNCLPRWREQCRRFFGFDGIWSGCAIGPRGERIFGYSGVELWPGNAAWLAHHYWLHFLYSHDKEFLRDRALPMMRLAFLTYANLLEPGSDGKLHIPLSYSPEYYEGSFESFCQDPTCDLTLIRFLGNALLKSNEVLGRRDDLTDRVHEVLANLTDYPQKDGRLWVSAGTPLAHSHRHHSHLMGVHPLGVLTIEGTEQERALIRNSLHDIRVKGVGEWTGWAFPWMSLIASRAAYGNMAWQMLDIYANSFITPNTFHINGDPRIFGLSLFDYSPMTLEAGFGAAAAIMEMLLQSYDGCIRVFPSMPDRWHDAYFSNLRTEGAFLVTAKTTEGRVRFVLVTSEAGLPCVLKNPFNGDAEVVRVGKTCDAPQETPRKVSGPILRFDTVPAGRYLLYPSGARPDDFRPPRVRRTAAERNFYGVKHLDRF